MLCLQHMLRIASLRMNRIKSLPRMGALQWRTTAATKVWFAGLAYLGVIGCYRMWMTLGMTTFPCERSMFQGCSRFAPQWAAFCQLWLPSLCWAFVCGVFPVALRANLFKPSSWHQDLFETWGQLNYIVERSFPLLPLQVVLLRFHFQWTGQS